MLLLSHSFCGSEVSEHSLAGSSAWDLTDCSPSVSQGPSLMWGPSGRSTSISRLTKVIDAVDFLVVEWPRVLLGAGCWLKAALGFQRPFTVPALWLSPIRPFISSVQQEDTLTLVRKTEVIQNII